MEELKEKKEYNMLSEQDILFHIEDTINISKQNYKKIKETNINELKSEANQHLDFLSILSNEDNRFNTMLYQLSFWANVSQDEKIRNASMKANKELNDYLMKVYKNKIVYKNVLDFYVKFTSLLSDVQLRFLRWYIKNLDRSGVTLPSEKQSKLLATENTLLSHEIKFNDNINNSNEVILLTKKELDGLPDDMLTSLEMKDKKYVIPLKSLPYNTCMKTIHDPEIRKLICHAYNNVCVNENKKIFVEMILLRYSKAKLLKKNSYTEYVGEQLHLKKPKDIIKILETLNSNFESLFLEEIRALLREKKSDNIINFWDIDYYFQIINKKIIGDSLKDIHNYFSLDQVEKIAFELCDILFGICFEKNTTDKVWHSDVKVFTVIDKVSKIPLGTLYFDLFPRSNKNDHPSCYIILPFCQYFNNKMESNKNQNPIIAILASFPRLLNHSQVIDYFHELGHAVYDLCGRCSFARLSGEGIEPDFIDVPSLLMENWCWEKKLLMKFTHWKTGENLSPEIISKLIKQRHINNGFHYKRQLALSLFDIVIHSHIKLIKSIREKYSKGDIDGAISLIQTTFKLAYDTMMSSKARDTIESFSVKLPDNIFIPCNWSHMVGYDSKYFCYIWGEILSDEIFQIKFKPDIYSSEIGTAYRKCILNTGATINYKKLLLDFIKNPISMDSFLNTRVFIVRGELDNEDYIPEDSEISNASIDDTLFLKKSL